MSIFNHKYCGDVCDCGYDEPYAYGDMDHLLAEIERRKEIERMPWKLPDPSLPSVSEVIRRTWEGLDGDGI